MLERESDWRRFIEIVQRGSVPHETLAKETQVSMNVVRGYYDQCHGRGTAHTFGVMPDYLLDRIVGFRYRRLPRWVMTKDIKQARDDYDAGLVELAQGLYKIKGEDAWVLFAFKRRQARKPRKGQDLLYFSAPVL